MKFQFSAFADESSNSFLGQVDALRRNGYSYLEIRNLDNKGVCALSLDEARELNQILLDNGLGVWSIGSPIGKIPAHGDFEAHLDQYKHTLELAAAFETKHIRLFSFFMPKDEDPENYKNLVLDRLSLFAELAAPYGVVLCHENEKGIYGDIASRCLNIHKAVPGIKAVFDPANYVQSGQDTLAAWELLSPYVEYMHIKDSLVDGTVVPPGTGAGNVFALLKKYEGVGTGVLTLEPHLYSFVGLKALEQEGDESIVGGMSFATPEAAFDYAAKCLNELVEKL